MIKIILPLLLLMISCEKGKVTEPSKVVNSIAEEVSSKTRDNRDAESAKDWLTKAIFNQYNSPNNLGEENWKKITTPEYYSYKIDAMNVDMDVEGSLSEKEFEGKWKNKFNPKKAGVGLGFLIDAQDWDKIEMTKCDLLSEGNNSFLFDVNLLDTGFKANYPIQIKVSKKDFQFLIADVLQEQPNN
ncbi:hypothetical protein [Chryseobacterium sp.]|uniref:hypothetical protein n=1 Tax=Chryseobacterium sp. TaxID=1871047 RepID=UPI00388E04B2